MIISPYDEMAVTKLSFLGEFVGWCKQISLENHPFGFGGHEYLEDLYLDQSQHIIVIKAAQLGFSTYALLLSVHGCIYIYENGVLYLLSTIGSVTEFSKGKLSKLIEDNEIIKSAMQRTDSATLKRLGRAFLYFRGSGVRSALKSITVDMLIVDEFDEHDPKKIDLAVERLAHSKFKRRLDMSTPTLPDFGIDYLYQQSNQKQYAHKCSRCNHWNILENTFPECLMEVGKPVEKGGKVIKVCSKCREKLVPKISQWVKTCLDQRLPNGYSISQLNSCMVTAEELLLKYKQHILRMIPVTGGGSPNPAEFWNSCMGKAFVSAANRLTKEQVWACCDTYGIESHDLGPCSMGVDQGNDLHVVIGTKRFGKSRIVYLGIHQEWQELDKLIRQYNVHACVVDALPEKRNAKAFASLVAGRCMVWLNFYVPSRKVGTWYDDKGLVECDRTESLDESHTQLSAEEIVLPRRSDLVDDFATHCNNIAKKLEEDPETGSKRYVYVKLGSGKPDHFRHAFNYECLARMRLPSGTGDGVVVGTERISAQGEW